MVSPVKLKSGSKILEELSTIHSLRTIPTTLNRILEEFSDSEGNMEQIAELIMKDQVLTTRVLRLVNSAYFGLGHKISSLKQAILLLGLRRIRRLVLSTLLFPQFDAFAVQIPIVWFWEHALSCARGADLLDPGQGSGGSDLCYVAGLVHDIGELIMAQYFPGEFDAAFTIARQKSMNLYRAEKELFGISHCEIGAILAESWNFPRSLTLSIRYHHTPEEAKNESILPAIVNLSDIFTRLLGVNYGIQEEMLIIITEQPGFQILQQKNQVYGQLDWERLSLELMDQFQQIVGSVKEFFIHPDRQ